MEPNNIEDLIREHFKERSIAPSSEARDRLIRALNTEPKKKKKFWVQYAVAASLLLGLLFGGTQFLLKDDATEIPVKIGFEEVNPALDHNEGSSILDNDSEGIIALEEVQDSVSQETKSENLMKLSQFKASPSQQQLADVSNAKENEEAEVNSEVPLEKNSKETLLVTDTQKVLAVAKAKEGFQYITAEKLLRVTTADRQIELNKNSTKESKSYLESDALLAEIETELFDEKNKNIFKKAGKQLKEFKETVANRNYKDHN